MPDCQGFQGIELHRGTYLPKVPSQGNPEAKDNIYRGDFSRIARGSGGSSLL